MYKYYNQNKDGRHINDCTVRAISLAQNKTWDETYKELSNLARERGMMFDSVEFVEDYLDERYYRQCHYSKTVGEFADEFIKGTYLITMNGHITCCIDGVIIDTFDCRDRIMRCCWKVKNNLDI